MKCFWTGKPLGIELHELEVGESRSGRHIVVDNVQELRVVRLGKMRAMPKRRTMLPLAGPRRDRWCC